MFTVVLTAVPIIYLDPLPTRCYLRDRPFEATTREGAEEYRKTLQRQFPDCTYEVQPVTEDEVVSFQAQIA